MEARVADLADPGNCAACAAECVERFGGLDILGNIAGIYLAAHIMDATLEQYRRVMAVNLDASFLCAQSAISHALERGGGTVDVASVAGIQGMPYSAVYALDNGFAVS